MANQELTSSEFDTVYTESYIRLDVTDPSGLNRQVKTSIAVTSEFDVMLSRGRRRSPASAL